VSRRIPLLAGSRIAVVEALDDAVVLAPPEPVEGVADVPAAVRDALRFPLAGDPLEALISPGGRATIVVEPPVLPIPGSADDPRRAALAATSDELVRAGVPSERQTILVAAGLARRPGRSELEALVSPEFARRFHGHVDVHDVEAEDLAAVGADDGELAVNRALVETDLLVTVTAAESVLHGGPAALLAAGGAAELRAAGAESLLEASTSEGWRRSVELESALARRRPVVGVSLVVTNPRLTGTFRGFPYQREAADRVARSPARRLFGLLPGRIRGRVLRSLPLELGVAAAFAGPPSVAHAEALLHGVEARSAALDEPLDALCVGVPAVTPHLPRERPNPVLAAHLGLALALRLWRDAFPVVPGGAVVLVHPLDRHFAHPTQQPYRALFPAGRAQATRPQLEELERAAAADERAVKAYRDGRACHPLLPFADWDACRPALDRLGAVFVAGCRDATAARQLGFVPTHGIGAALEMVRGRAGRNARIGFLLSPPYFPLKVGES
jgi:Lactate racemase N-terminal domain